MSTWTVCGGRGLVFVCMCACRVTSCNGRFLLGPVPEENRSWWIICSEVGPHRNAKKGLVCEATKKKTPTAEWRKWNYDMRVWKNTSRPYHWHTCLSATPNNCLCTPHIQTWVHVLNPKITTWPYALKYFHFKRRFPSLSPSKLTPIYSIGACLTFCGFIRKVQNTGDLHEDLLMGGGREG